MQLCVSLLDLKVTYSNPKYSQSQPLMESEAILMEVIVNFLVYRRIVWYIDVVVLLNMIIILSVNKLIQLQLLLCQVDGLVQFSIYCLHVPRQMKLFGPFCAISSCVITANSAERALKLLSHHRILANKTLYRYIDPCRTAHLSQNFLWVGENSNGMIRIEKYSRVCLYLLASHAYNIGTFKFTHTWVCEKPALFLFGSYI